MSEMAKSARAAMKAKVSRLTTDPHQKVDASSWTPPEPINADVKTGLRPVSKRAYKRGGKVTGSVTVERADRKSRGKKAAGGASDFTAMANANKDANREAAVRRIIDEANAPMPMPRRDRSADYLPTDRAFAPENRGGRVGRKNGGKAITADSMVNRDVKEADKDRDGSGAHVGGYAKGGSTYGTSTPLRLKKTVTGSNPAKSAKIYKDPDWDEYRVKHYQDGQHLSKADYHTDDMDDAHDTATNFVNKNRGGSVARAKGGKVSHMEWEHSKTDLAQDKKLAKKHGMSMSAWEDSKLDQKHDAQQSPKGLKSGGKAHEDDCRCTKCWGGAAEAKGGRKARATGGGILGDLMGGHTHGKGKKSKGKPSINIVINAGKAETGAPGGMPPAGPAHLPPMPPPRPAGMMPPMAPPGMPGLPPGGPAGGPGLPPGLAGGLPPGLPMRKAGGRVYRSYKDIDAGAGGGLGRLEKTEIQSRKR